MSSIKKYLSDVGAAFEGLILVLIDRARGKELNLDYINEYKEQIIMHKNLSGKALLADEVIVIEALKVYNKLVAYGFKDADILIRNYIEKGGNNG